MARRTSDDIAVLAQHGVWLLPEMVEPRGPEHLWPWPQPGLDEAAALARRLVVLSYSRAAGNLVLAPFGRRVPARLQGPANLVDAVRDGYKAGMAEASVEAAQAEQARLEYSAFMRAVAIGGGFFSPADHQAGLRWVDRQGRGEAAAGEVLAEAALNKIPKAWAVPTATDGQTVLWLAAGVGIAFATAPNLQTAALGGGLALAYMIWSGTGSRWKAWRWYAPERAAEVNGSIRAQTAGAIEAPDVWVRDPGALGRLTQAGVVVLPGRARGGMFAALEVMARGLPFWAPVMHRAEVESVKSYDQAHVRLMVEALGETPPDQAWADRGEILRYLREHFDAADAGPGEVRLKPELATRQAVVDAYRILREVALNPCWTPVDYRRAVVDVRRSGAARLPGEQLAADAVQYLPFAIDPEARVRGGFNGYSAVVVLAVSLASRFFPGSAFIGLAIAAGLAVLGRGLAGWIYSPRRLRQRVERLRKKALDRRP